MTELFRTLGARASINDSGGGTVGRGKNGLLSLSYANTSHNWNTATLMLWSDSHGYTSGNDMPVLAQANDFLPMDASTALAEPGPLTLLAAALAALGLARSVPTRSGGRAPVPRQAVVNPRGRHRRLAGGHADLVQSAHHVADRK